MNDGKIRLWTCQNPALFNMIQKNGVGYCTIDSWMAKEFSPAYQWMADQMQKRIGKPDLNNINKRPLWAWLYYNGSSLPKPKRSIDLFGTDDNELVYMELLLT